MNIQLRAMIRTAMILGTCAIGAGIVAFIIANFSFETIMKAIAIGFIVFGVYIVYNICLSQLKYEEKLKEKVDSK